MRRMVTSSLVLLPVLAFSQAGIASTSSASLRADLTRSAAPANAAVIEVSRSDRSRTLEYAAMGDVPSLSGPQLTRTVAVPLSDDEMKSVPAVTNVVVSGTVDKSGHPRNLVVTRSAGELVDKRTLEAVSQYRFMPATRDSLPVESQVSVSITIRK